MYYFFTMIVIHTAMRKGCNTALLGIQLRGFFEILALDYFNPSFLQPCSAKCFMKARRESKKS